MARTYRWILGATLAVAVGCTSSTETLLAPPRGRVHVTVRHGSGDPAPATPFEGARVAFIEPRGAATVVTTDAFGEASAVVSPRATVVVVAREGGNPTVVAYLGVSPGADLQVGPTAASIPPETVSTVAFAASAPPGTTSLGLMMPCLTHSDWSGAVADVTLVATLGFPCEHAASAPIVAFARDDSGAYLGYAALLGQDLASLPGSTVTLPAFEPLSLATATFSGLPAGMNDVQVTFGMRAPGVNLFSYGRWGPATAGAATVGVPAIPVGTETNVWMRALDVNGATTRVRRHAGVRLREHLDGAEGLLPIVGGPSSPSWSAARTIGWPESPLLPGRDPDLVVVRAWAHVTSSAKSVDYVVYARPTGGPAVTLPALPPELADVDPAVSDSRSVLQVSLVAVPDVGGFDALADTAQRDLEYLDHPFPDLAEIEVWESSWFD